jgi:hypothetical protein
MVTLFDPVGNNTWGMQTAWEPKVCLFNSGSRGDVAFQTRPPACLSAAITPDGGLYRLGMVWCEDANRSLYRSPLKRGTDFVRLVALHLESIPFSGVRCLGCRGTGKSDPGNISSPASSDISETRIMHHVEIYAKEGIACYFEHFILLRMLRYAGWRARSAHLRNNATRFTPACLQAW